MYYHIFIHICEKMMELYFLRYYLYITL
jgi:hypothetical protein